MTQVLSFASLNLVDASEVPFEFAYQDPNTLEDTAFIVKVIGANAKKIEDLVKSNYDAKNRADDLQRRKGKPVESEPVEKVIEFGNKVAAARVVGWSGLDIEYSPEKALELVKINPAFKEQVLKHSDNIANFTPKV